MTMVCLQNKSSPNHWHAILLCVFLIACSLGVCFLMYNSSENIEGSVERYVINDTCWAEYPQISGFRNLNKQSRINTLLKNNILEEYTKEPELQRMSNDLPAAEQNAVYLNYRIQCEIKSCNREMISLLLIRYLAWDGAPIKSNREYVINYNLKAEHPVDISELYHIDSSFIKKCMSRKYALYMDPLIEEYSENEYEGYIDFWLFDLGLTNTFEESVYFTEFNLGVNIWQPMTTGNYWVFEIPYKDIEQWRLK